jgi:hypothetical protein
MRRVTFFLWMKWCFKKFQVLKLKGGKIFNVVDGLLAGVSSTQERLSARMGLRHA